jgi:uncharacterized membrane protein YagU involved in acid resistance
MSSLEQSRTHVTSPGRSMVAGAIAGLGGGLVFGIMMGMIGMLPMVAMLVGSENPVVGFLVHMVISAIIGAIFGLVAFRLPENLVTASVVGALYGGVWWVLGALILMPWMLGMAAMILQIGADQWMSLVGHLLYGIILGILFIPLRRRL